MKNNKTFEGMLLGEGLKFGLVVARFNDFITNKMLEGGVSPNKPVAIIESGTYPQQRTLIDTLGNIVKEAEKNKIKPPAVIVIGEVANLGRKLAWFKKPIA